MSVGIFGFGFGLFFIIIFLFIVGVFVYIISTNIKKGVKNNNSPRLTVDAKVIVKRQQVRGDHSYTIYYATFEFESGDRLELEMKGDESGMVAEGDQGKLTFQGSRFLSFSRG